LENKQAQQVSPKNRLKPKRKTLRNKLQQQQILQHHNKPLEEKENKELPTTQSTKISKRILKNKVNTRSPELD